MQPLIGYIRVSTAKQGISGLGLEAQLSAIDTFARQSGGEVIRMYREVESGRNNERPQLSAAIAHAKRARAKLVIAKLDRLARNVHFVSGLMETKVDFIALDIPNANPLTIHIMAAMAEAEAMAISARTKAALAAAKARGVLLGSARPGAWSGKEDIRVAALVKARQAEAERRSRARREISAAVQAAMKMTAADATLSVIAAELNRQDHRTVTGRPWTVFSVCRAIKRKSAEKVPESA
jgi:DNA invertase Pin-like site-specific DNA recombinase